MNASSDNSLNANSSEGSWSVSNPLKGIDIDETIDAIWNAVILGESKFNSEKTCYDLADEYRRSGRTTKQHVENFINGQTAQASLVGFMLGAPGFIPPAVAVPSDLRACAYFQMRAVAVIALLCGWDVKSNHVKTIALHSMAGGSSTGAAAQGAGRSGAKMAGVWLKNLPGSVIAAINRELGFRCVTKFGSEGLINLAEFIPVIGGLISGGLNAVLTNQAGWLAYRALKSRHGDDVSIDWKLDEVGPNGSCANEGAKTPVHHHDKHH